MMFKTVATVLCALAVSGVKGTDSTPVAPQVQQSVLLALAQAIPTESVAYALASPSAFAVGMASSLSAGHTPAWYSALPTDVQSLLPECYPQAIATPTPSSWSSSAVQSSKASASVMPYPTAALNSTLVAGPTAVTATGVPTVTSSLGSSSTTTPDSPSFTGAASQMSVGAGLGAAIVFGLLAL